MPKIWSSYYFALQQIWGCGELRQLSPLHRAAALRHSPGRLHHSVSVGGDEKSGRGATDQLLVVFRKCRRADCQTSQSSSDHQTVFVNPALALWENLFKKRSTLVTAQTCPVISHSVLFQDLQLSFSKLLRRKNGTQPRPKWINLTCYSENPITDTMMIVSFISNKPASNPVGLRKWPLDTELHAPLFHIATWTPRTTVWSSMYREVY